MFYLNNDEKIKFFNSNIFGDMLVLDLEGKPYFPAIKVATILGCKRPDNAIARHCILDYPWALKRGVGVQTGTQVNGEPALRSTEVNFIDDENIRRLIFHSTSDKKEELEKWIFEEIIPSFKKN